MKGRLLDIFFSVLLFAATFPVGFATIIVDKPYGSEPPWLILLMGGIACSMAIGFFWQLGFATLLILKVKSAYRLSLLVFLFLLVVLACTMGLLFPKPYQKYKRKRFMYVMRDDLEKRIEERVKRSTNLSPLIEENTWSIANCVIDKFDDDRYRVDEMMEAGDPVGFFMHVAEEENFIEECMEEQNSRRSYYESH